MMLIVVQRSEGIGIRWYSQGATQLVGDGFRSTHIRFAIASDLILGCRGSRTALIGGESNRAFRRGQDKD